MDLLWTPELYQEALDKFQFIVLTSIGLQRVNVTDMKAIWVLHPDFLFNTTYRVAGKREDIKVQMGNSGYDEEQLSGLMEIIDNNSITKDNFESLLDEDSQSVYEVELASYEQWKDQFLESQTGVKGLTLLELLKMINPHMSMVEERKVFPRIPTSTGSGRGAGGKASEKATPSPKGKVGRKSTSLQDKIDKALDEEKLINVTNITETGTGTVSNPRRGRTSLFVAPNLPITSSKLQGVLIAIDLLGGEEEHPEDYQAALEFKWKDDSSPKSTPKTTTKTTSTTTTSTTRIFIPQSKTVVPEAVKPVRTNLLPVPMGKKPIALVSGLAVPDNSDI